MKLVIIDAGIAISVEEIDVVEATVDSKGRYRLRMGEAFMSGANPEHVKIFPQAIKMEVGQEITEALIVEAIDMNSFVQPSAKDQLKALEETVSNLQKMVNTQSAELDTVKSDILVATKSRTIGI